ncbi:hypothetical protein WMY93_018453 [Mugilogobius chulae]|uniref:cGMP-dependent protein kinase n=1 Tax=Mugilogobius chulae TaxID=88201 RepID=A0AAW0NN55_9GOBI
MIFDALLQSDFLPELFLTRQVIFEALLQNDFLKDGVSVLLYSSPPVCSKLLSGSITRQMIFEALLQNDFLKDDSPGSPVGSQVLSLQNWSDVLLDSSKERLPEGAVFVDISEDVSVCSPNSSDGLRGFAAERLPEGDVSEDSPGSPLTTRQMIFEALLKNNFLQEQFLTGQMIFVALLKNDFLKELFLTHQMIFEALLQNDFLKELELTGQMIFEALLKNDFLKELELKVLQEISDCMCETEYETGARVVQEGAHGEFLYVLTGKDQESICTSSQVTTRRVSVRPRKDQESICNDQESICTSSQVTTGRVSVRPHRPGEYLYVLTGNDQESSYTSSQVTTGRVSVRPGEYLYVLTGGVLGGGAERETSGSNVSWDSVWRTGHFVQPVKELPRSQVERAKERLRSQVEQAKERLQSQVERVKNGYGHSCVSGSGLGVGSTEFSVYCEKNEHQQRHQEYCSFLRSVSLLKDLPEDTLSRVADCLHVDYYDKGEVIIREGEEGDTFFIIAKGQVLVTQRLGGFFTEPQEIKTLTVDSVSGKSEDVRSANVICNENDTHCLVLDRESFTQMFGSLEDLQVHLRSYVEELQLSDQRRRRCGLISPGLDQDLDLDPAQRSELLRLRHKLDLLKPDRPLDQLELISTLGTGGFGRVELVKLRDEDVSFALKCIKNQHVVQHKQQEHVFSEKNLLQQSNCPSSFFRTFRDQKFVYLLLEACLGGELWTVLRDKSFFDESTARFCSACVIEALQYLHQKNIIYRDLKPENLLLDQDGYVKLVDFGFAKRLVLGQKTWTFCGTPEYVAPEIILNRGHDSAVDLWALGILLHELLTGSPPFSGPDPMKIYTSILRGVEKVDFPKKIRKRAEDLIRRLCRLNPVERLGNNKNGITDVKTHKSQEPQTTVTLTFFLRTQKNLRTSPQAGTNTSDSSPVQIQLAPES